MGRWTRVAESDPWPFSDPPATRVLTTRRIALMVDLSSTSFMRRTDFWESSMARSSKMTI